MQGLNSWNSDQMARLATTTCVACTNHHEYSIKEWVAKKNQKKALPLYHWSFRNGKIFLGLFVLEYFIYIYIYIMTATLFLRVWHVAFLLGFRNDMWHAHQILTDNSCFVFWNSNESLWLSYNISISTKSAHSFPKNFAKVCQSLQIQPTVSSNLVYP